MSNTNKTTPTTETELNTLLEYAVNEGDMLEIDRLMAVDVPKEEEQEELPDKEEKPVEKEDGTSDGNEVVKEEAAPKKEAASKPEDEQHQQVIEDPEHLKKEIHRLKSDIGRVPFMQSRMKDLERELRELKLSRNVEATSNTDPDKIRSVEVPGNIKKKIDDLREVDPSLADLLEDLTKTMRSESQDTAQRVVSTISQTDRELEDQRTSQEQFQSLVTEVPWAPQAFQSQEWKEWKSQLTPGRLAMAESAYADDVKIALNAFAQDMNARQGGNVTNATQDVPSGNNEAEKIKQDRDRKLNSGGNVKAPVAKSGPGILDEEAYFKEAYEAIQKENHL